MNIMTKRLMIAALELGLCTGLLAEEKQEYAQISLCGLSGGKTTKNPSEFVTLVVEGSILFHDGTAIPSVGVVDAVNTLLKAKDTTYIGIYVREDTKYGDVVRALDALRKTNAKNIGVCMAELAYGRDP